jgi:hypothetical protein
MVLRVVSRPWNRISDPCFINSDRVPWSLLISVARDEPELLLLSLFPVNPPTAQVV